MYICSLGGGIKHITVEMTGDGQLFFKDEKFNSLTDLVRFYSTHPVPNMEGFTNVYLRTPVILSSSADNLLISNQQADKLSSLANARKVNQRKSDGSIKSQINKAVNNLATPQKHSKTHTNNQCNNSENFKSRPPMPLPVLKPVTDPSLYSEARDENLDMSKELISQLKLSNVDKVERCECGLTAEESELPMGWSLHISHEHGRVFFTAPDGKTSWNLPLDVSIELSPDQQDNLKRIIVALEAQQLV